MASERAIAVALTLTAAILWGTSFSANDYGLRYVDAPTFAFLRFFVAAIATVALAHALGGVEWRLGRRPLLWAMGFFNALGFLLQYLGQEITTPAKTALFVNLDVLWVAALSYAWYDERFTGAKVTAILLALGGATLLEVGGGFHELTVGSLAAVANDLVAGGSARGDLYVFMGGAAWAVFILLNKRAVGLERLPVLSVTSWIFITTAAFLAPTLLFADGAAVPAAGWAAILYTAIVCTTVAYALWSRGLQHITATVSAVILLLEIAVAIAISLAVGRESFTAVSAVGAAALLVAIVLASVAPGGGEAAPEPHGGGAGGGD